MANLFPAYNAGRSRVYFRDVAPATASSPTPDVAPSRPVVSAPPPPETHSAVTPPGAARSPSTSRYYTYRPVQSAYDIIQARSYADFDSYGRSLIESIVANVVGFGGISVNFGDAKLNDEFANWRWNLTRPDEPVDILERSVVRAILRDGESLVQFVPRKDGLFMRELDALDLPLTRPYDPPGAVVRQGIVINGIELSADRVPIAYHFRPYYGATIGNYATVLPAAAVVHTYTTQYPYQLRGNSWMRGAIEPLALLRQYECDYVEQMSIAAVAPGFFGFDPSVLGEFPTISESASDEERAAHIRSLMERMASSNPKSRMAFPTGITWNPMNYPNVLGGDTYEAIKKGLLGRIGQAMGLTYYTVAGIFEATSFSSSRAARLEDISTYREIQKVLLSFMKRVVREWLIWKRLNDSTVGDREIKIEFNSPSFGFIDPVREVNAHRMEWEMGIRSLTEVIEESGRNREQVFDQIVQDQADMDAKLRAKGLPPKYGNADN